MVVHAVLSTPDAGGAGRELSGPVVRVGGPRFGLIVSKAVGTAVVRHRVARRLRHICTPLTDELPAEADIVIRALPGAARAPSAELDRQLRGALRKLFPDAVRSDASPAERGGPG